MTQSNQKPPSTAQRIMRVADLPSDRKPARYELRNGTSKPRIVMLDNRKRQIVDLLVSAPVYCASPVRLSDVVHILKREIGLEVDTKYYPGNPITGSGAYGVYFLMSDIRRIDDCEVAA